METVWTLGGPPFLFLISFNDSSHKEFKRMLEAIFNQILNYEEHKFD